MRCPVCAQEISDAAKFCRHCRTDLRQVVPPTVNVAPSSVEAERISCPVCAAPHAPGARFCKSCGHRFEASAVTPVLLPAVSPLAAAPIPDLVAPLAAPEPAVNPRLALNAQVAATTSSPRFMTQTGGQSASVSVTPPQKSSAGLFALIAIVVAALGGGGWWWSQQAKEPVVTVAIQSSAPTPASVPVAPEPSPAALPADPVAPVAPPVVQAAPEAAPVAQADASAALLAQKKAADKKLEDARKVKKAEEVKAAKQAAQENAAAEKAAARAKAQEAAHASPAPTPARAAPTDWHAALRADLDTCSRQPFLQKIVCNEKARWKHCPGHWGKSEECKENTYNPDSNG